MSNWTSKQAEAQQERVRYLRKALYIACGNDKQRVMACMEQAEAVEVIKLQPYFSHRRVSDG